MPLAIIAVETFDSVKTSLTRGAALQYELGLVLQHQYSLVPIVPLNCVRPSAVRGVRVYHLDLQHAWPIPSNETWTEQTRGCFHTTRGGQTVGALAPHNSQRVACVLPSTRKAANHIVKTVQFAAVRGALSTVRC